MQNSQNLGVAGSGIGSEAYFDAEEWSKGQQHPQKTPNINKAARKQAGHLSLQPNNGRGQSQLIELR